VIENRPLSGGSHLLRIGFAEGRRDAPRSQPGQFAMLAKHPSQHLVRRPMSIHDEGDGWLQFMVKPVGPASTEIVSLRAGDPIDASPPLGRGFPLHDLGGGPIVLVGGGFGIAPLHFVARRLDAASGAAAEYRILYGGRTRRDVELDVLDGVRGETLPSTDDGSLGFHGTCVDLAQRIVANLGARGRSATVLTCGSHAMMQALSVALRGRVRVVYASLEEIMACGVGVCMGCVCRTTSGYVPICTHGPVFRADDVFGVATTEVSHVEV
jgi:dihydroorotate dehydrogenase electron transfer subunit